MTSKAFMFPLTSSIYDEDKYWKCRKLSISYFFFPLACQCNGQAKECNHKSGKCHCTTKGIIGEKCERCDIVNHYYGDPVKNSCYYDLAIDYQFTFNLSKTEDKHLRGINFKNTPTKTDVDVDFSITCSVSAKMNMTVKYTDHEGTKEKQIVTDQNCTQFKSRFSKDEFIFGEDANTTFYIHVFDFEPPLWIIISFSQHPKLDLLQFFITFSTCFLALLLIAAVLWKIKQKFDRYRRRQRLYVEMEQMASRPFGSVLVELDKLPDHNSGSGSSLPNSSTVNSSLNEHNTTGNSSNAMPLTGGAPVNLHHSKTSNRSSSNDRNAPSGGGERISTLPSGVAVNREENVTNVRRRRKVR